MPCRWPETAPAEDIAPRRRRREPRGRGVGQRAQRLVELGVEAAHCFLTLLQPRLEDGDLGDQRRRVRLVARRLGGADPPRRGIALGARRLRRPHLLAPRPVENDQPGGDRESQAASQFSASGLASCRSHAVVIPRGTPVETTNKSRPRRHYPSERSLSTTPRGRRTSKPLTSDPI